MIRHVTTKLLKFLEEYGHLIDGGDAAPVAEHQIIFDDLCDGLPVCSPVICQHEGKEYLKNGSRSLSVLKEFFQDKTIPFYISLREKKIYRTSQPDPEWMPATAITHTIPFVGWSRRNLPDDLLDLGEKIVKHYRDSDLSVAVVRCMIDDSRLERALMRR